MALSRTLKSALILTFNCWGVLVYVVWQVIPHPNTTPQFAVIEYDGLDLLFFEYLILAVPVILILGIGSTLACGVLLWREHFPYTPDFTSLKITEPTGAKPNRRDFQD